MIHDDRISYPLCFIFYTPRDSQVRFLLTLRALLNCSLPAHALNNVTLEMPSLDQCKNSNI